MFNQGIPTGIEIKYEQTLENMVIVNIPKTNYQLIGIKNDNKNWSVGMMDRLKCYKRKINENMEEKAFVFLIQYILAHKDQTQFKLSSFNVLKEHYKLILTQAKSSKKRFDSKITL